MRPGFVAGCLLILSPLFGQTGSPERPKNIIMVIGDGMGLAHIALAEYLHRPPSPLQRMEIVGLQKTHSDSHLETDSGASGTAMSCGVETFNAAIGVDADSVPVTTIMELARDHGYKTGFVVTSSVVHATPASFYAHVPSRGSYESIATQLVESGIDVFVGGGEKYFYNRNLDNKDLLGLLRTKNYELIRSQDPHGKFRVDNIPREKKIACFTAFEDPARASLGRTYFPWMVQKALDALEKRADKGY
ncbi:MAG TPA: alkaline phosphatase, partial [Saprospiraceae bacterium]|nr:alkaline phosphatase [Saprospiraceae bacterium]